MAAAGKSIDENDPPASPSEGGEPEPRPSWIKLGLLALVMIALLILFYASPLRQYLGRLHEVSERIRSFGVLAPLVFTLGVAGLVAIGFPRLVLCAIAGMALGFWSGLLWAQLGTLIGNYALFVVARAAGRDWARRHLVSRANLNRIIQQRGVLGVILARQLPLPGLAINLACALLPLRHADFLLGTLIGQLPQAVPWTLIGAGALQESFGKSIGLVGLAVGAAILIWLGVRWVWRRSKAGDREVPP